MLAHYARVFGKSKVEAFGKALVGSLYSIGKDYVGKGSGKVVYVIGGRAAEAATNAAIEGKSVRDIYTLRMNPWRSPHLSL